MTDPFFSARTCARCGADLEKTGRTMSMFNTEAICPACKDAERLRPDYAAAEKAELAAVQRGDFNYPGIEGEAKNS